MSPRRNEEIPSPGTAVTQRETGALSTDVLSDELRADLLRAQAGQINLAGKLNRIKVMGSGAGMFEIPDANEDPFRDFMAIILNSHPANVLWDRPYGSTTVVSDDEKMAACTSNDGRYGIPRKGFRHAGLPGNNLREGVTVGNSVGDGITQVECATCPYNKWGTGSLFVPNRNPKGKAVTNQHVLYVLVEGREMPLKLALPSKSLRTFEKYIKDLTDTGKPVQTVLTRVFQTVEGPATNRYGVVQFQNVGNLTGPEMQMMMEKRTRYHAAIHPVSEARDVEIIDAPMPDIGADEEDNVPF